MQVEAQITNDGVFWTSTYKRPAIRVTDVYGLHIMYILDILSEVMLRIGVRVKAIALRLQMRDG